LTKSCPHKEAPVRDWVLPREGPPGYQSSLQGRGRAVWMEAMEEGKVVKPLLFRGRELFVQLSCSCNYNLSSSILLIFKFTL